MNAETQSLACYLDEQRDSVLEIVDGLPEAALGRAVFRPGWTCLGLIHHLAIDDERNWFGGVAAGTRPTSRRVRIRAGWPGRKPRPGRCSVPCRGEIARMASSR